MEVGYIPVKGLEKIGLGGGCHWCTEGVFISLKGVAKVEQGWIASTPPNDSFSEAVIVHYDPEQIDARDLIVVHLETHASTKVHNLRHRYRSAVYAFTEADRIRFDRVLAEASAQHSGRVITTVLPYGAFKPSLPEHQDYYRTDPERPFCVRHISPKLEKLRQRRGHLLK